MKKIIPFLLVVAALLAFVSCKAESSEPESFTVTFDLNGGTVSKDIEDQTVKSGEKAAKPADTPTNDSSKGFKFWTVDGKNKYDFNTPVRKDLTIKAVYWTDAEVAEIEKEVYCFGRIAYTLCFNGKLYDGTEASKIYDITDTSDTSDADDVRHLLMWSLLSGKYNSDDEKFDFYVTHDGSEYKIDKSSIQLVDFSVKENKSTKTAGKEVYGTYNIKLENVTIKAKFTYTEGSTSWTETLKTDFTVDAVVTISANTEGSATYITLESSMPVNGAEYSVLNYTDVSTGKYEYKGYTGILKLM